MFKGEYIIPPFHCQRQTTINLKAEICLSSSSFVPSTLTPLLFNVARTAGGRWQVRIMAAAGGDVNARARTGWTPLHYASVSSDREYLR
jgi:ankyrin repeat protein